MSVDPFVGQEHFQRRDDVIAMLPRPLGRILDVGCGPGLTGQALLEQGALEVWGIERDKELAAEASTRLTRVLGSDLEADPTGGLPAGYFDTIVYADILEHLIDPWTLLKRQRPLLAERGAIVASIPNVRNLRVVLPLILKGEWAYTEEGLLSIGHVRFFTTRSMREMLISSGFRIEAESANYATRGRWLRRVSAGALDDLVARQRLFRAVRS